MRPLLPALVSLLVGGGALWLIAGPGPAQPTTVVERPVDEADEEAPDPVVLHGRAVPTTAEETGIDGAGAVLDEVFETEETRRLEGLVTDERDVPVAGVVVRVAEHEVVSAEDGTFELPLVSAEGAEVAVDPPEAWRLPDPVVVRPGQTRVHVRLQPGRSQRIFVLDAHGVPAADVRVSVHATWIGDAGGEASRRLAPGLTDEGGVFVARGLPPVARLDLRVGGGPWPELEYPDRETGPGEIVLRLPEPGVVEGVLADETGQPMGDVKVAVDGCNPAIWSVRRSTTTDASTGRFRFEGLAPGRYRVDVSPPAGYSHHHASAFIQAPRSDLRIRLSRYHNASGTVLAKDPGNVTVLWCLPGERKANTPREDGVFEFGGLPDLPAPLYARNAATGTAFLLEGARPGDGPFVVRLEPALTIRGRVPGFSDSRHDSILLGAARGELLIEGVLAPDDTFEITCVPPGVWAIVLWEKGACIRVEGVEAGATDVVVPLPPSDGR